MWSEFSVLFSWDFRKHWKYSKALKCIRAFRRKMPLNPVWEAVAENWPIYGGKSWSGKPKTKSQVLHSGISLSDPEPLAHCLNLDIRAVQRQTGQRIIQLLLDRSTFILKSASILSTYFTFSHPSLHSSANQPLYCVQKMKKRAAHCSRVLCHDVYTKLAHKVQHVVVPLPGCRVMWPMSNIVIFLGCILIHDIYHSISQSLLKHLIHT